MKKLYAYLGVVAILFLAFTAHAFTQRFGTTPSLEVTPNSTEAQVIHSGNTGLFEIEYEVTSLKTSAGVPNNVLFGNASSTAGAYVLLESSTGTTTIATSTVAFLDSSAEEQKGVFVIEEGVPETFTVTIEHTPSQAGFYRARLLQVGALDKENEAFFVREKVTPASAFTTAYIFVGPSF